jgi:hypothetical protein
MSVGNDLQKMENIEENAVTKGAKPAEPMQKLSTGGTPATWEDLGGPTPENYKSDDDSAKLKTPGATLKQVKDVVNKGAKPAEGAKGLKKEEEEKPADQVVSEEETTEEEVVAEAETTEVEETQEVVAEEETTEEEVVAENKIDVEEDLNALIAGEELSEEFQNKARTIFESAIKTKVAELSEQVKISYEEKLVEEVASVKRELQERVDSYLEYVASEWLEENQLAAEAGLKTEMTESFLEGMKSLFEEHYVTIPEEKYDVLNSMVDKLDEMENKLNEQIKNNVALNRRLAESVADVIFAEVTEGLADTQRDKLASLAENVEFESEADYREKLVTLRESYFPSNAGTQRDKSENLSEGEEASTPQPVSGLMESYLQTMSRVSKK